MFKVAFETWVDTSNERHFTEIIRESVKELKAVTAA